MLTLTRIMVLLSSNGCKKAVLSALSLVCTSGDGSQQHCLVGLYSHVCNCKIF